MAGGVGSGGRPCRQVAGGPAVAAAIAGPASTAGAAARAAAPAGVPTVAAIHGVQGVGGVGEVHGVAGGGLMSACPTLPGPACPSRRAALPHVLSSLLLQVFAQRELIPVRRPCWEATVYCCSPGCASALKQSQDIAKHTRVHPHLPPVIARRGRDTPPHRIHGPVTMFTTLLFQCLRNYPLNSKFWC